MMARIFALMLLAVPSPSFGAGCPVLGPSSVAVFQKPVAGQISKSFGMAMHPLLMITRMHSGIDLSGVKGEAVVSSAGGVVREARFNAEYGNYVVVDHGAGWETIYAHLDRVAISARDCVAAGQKVGTVGSTGISSGPHLHFELHRDGRPVDPTPFFSGH